MNNSIIKKLTLKSKKTGQDFVAYQFSIGKYKSPLLFPSEVEQFYIDSMIKKSAHTDFQEGLTEAEEEEEYNQ